MASMKQFYANVRAGAGGPGPQQYVIVELFVRVEGRDDRFGTDYQHAHHRETFHGILCRPQSHLVASFHGLDMLAVRTAHINENCIHLPYPETFTMNDIVPEPLGEMVRVWMCMWFVRALRVYVGATSPGNEDESPQRAPKPVCNQPTPAGNED